MHQKIITVTMEPALYRAAANGEIDALVQYRDKLDQFLTANNNTVLHVHITAISSSSCEITKSTNFVKQILTMCPPLLTMANSDGETPLHIAARFGHASIVKLLIGFRAEETKQMLRMTDQHLDTALHEAVRFGYLSVVKMLIREDVEFEYCGNDAGETPLYIAVERGYTAVALEILRKCVSPTTSGPIGRTALHAATIHKNEGSEIIKEILHKIGGQIIKQADEKGWTPLHHAAHMGYLPAVRLLLESPAGREAAYMQDIEGNTALHWAANLDHTQIMREIIEKCPDCFEITNQRGWNILHVAVRGEGSKAVELILEDPNLGNLLNHKDVKGNTPLHHSADLLHSGYLQDLINHRGVDKGAFNKNNQNAFDIASATKELSPFKSSVRGQLHRNGVKSGGRINTAFNDGEKENESLMINKFKESNLIVATLIATVTFAAGFTLPGGLSNEAGSQNGSPILGNKFAFRMFVLMDTLAFVLSFASVFISLLMISFKKDNSGTVYCLVMSFYFTVCAMAAMVVAFVTGMYAVLENTTAFAIFVCAIGLTFFLFFYLLLDKFCSSRDNYSGGYRDLMLQV